MPVVADGVVYTFGAEGQLHAIDLATGKRIWSEDTMRRFGVPKGFFGAAGSPLVENGRVMANVGGRQAGIVAFDAKTGKVLCLTRSGRLPGHRSCHRLCGRTQRLPTVSCMSGTTTPSSVSTCASDTELKTSSERRATSNESDPR